MVVISAEVRYSGRLTGNTFASQSYWRQSLKDVWNEIGWYFFKHFVEKHFTKSGAQEYREQNVAYGEVAANDTYRPRSGEGESGKAFWCSYNGRKQKQLGHQLAMVFSGDTRDGARRAKITATSKDATIALPGCVHLNYYKPHRKKRGSHAGEPPLNLRGDLLAISRRESETIRAMHERILVDRWSRAFLEKHVTKITP